MVPEHYSLLGHGLCDLVRHPLHALDDVVGVGWRRVRLLLEDGLVEVAVGGGNVGEELQPEKSNIGNISKHYHALKRRKERFLKTALKIFLCS